MSALDAIPEFDSGTQPGSPAARFEEVPCYACGSRRFAHLTLAEDDLTGKVGVYRFVTCSYCGFAYLNPRLKAEHILEFYGDDYISHSQRKILGPPPAALRIRGRRHRPQQGKDGAAFRPARPRQKAARRRLRRRLFPEASARAHGRRHHGPRLQGSLGPAGPARLALPPAACCTSRISASEKFDLITMWHFLEHDYDPLASLVAARDLLAEEGFLMIEVPRLDSRTRQLFGNRWPGLQAPQHTALYSRESLLPDGGKGRLRGGRIFALRRFSRLFLPLHRPRLQNPARQGARTCAGCLCPTFSARSSTSPILLFEKKLNLAMQTVVCRRRE